MLENLLEFPNILHVAILGGGVIIISKKLWQLKQVHDEVKRLRKEFPDLQVDEEKAEALRKQFGHKAMLLQFARPFFWALIPSYLIVRLLGKYESYSAVVTVATTLALALLPSLVSMWKSNKQLTKINMQHRERLLRVGELLDRVDEIGFEKLDEELDKLFKESEQRDLKRLDKPA
jgi:hypothetical protein